MIEILEGIIRDEETNPTARCTAIRTLLRIKDDVGSRELDEEFERICRARQARAAPSAARWAALELMALGYAVDEAVSLA